MTGGLQPVLDSGHHILVRGQDPKILVGLDVPVFGLCLDDLWGRPGMIAFRFAIGFPMIRKSTH